MAKLRPSLTTAILNLMTACIVNTNLQEKLHMISQWLLLNIDNVFNQSPLAEFLLHKFKLVMLLLGKC